MAELVNHRTTRTKLFTLLLFCICSKLALVFANECPQPCTCQDHLNLRVNCSHKILLSPPTISASTLTLDLSHNALGPVFNVSFVQMHNLSLIDLSHNAFTHVRDCTFSGMLGLKTVRLRGNRLASLPDGLFTDTTGLEDLDLSHNRFVELPQDVMKHLPKLKTFDISHNLISEVRLGLRYQVPRNIETIDLSHNPIEAITTDSFDIASHWETSTGRTINLAFCRISSIESGAVSKIPNIHDLDISGNDGITMDMLTDLVKKLESDARDLDRLSLSYLNVTTLVPLFTPVTLISLKFLNVSFNNINDVPFGVFSTIRSLRVLDLSWNSITRLAAGFSDLSNLKVLNISHNHMESFQGDAVNHLSNLQTLDLSYNKLTQSNRVNLSALTKLLHLIMNNNFLDSVILPNNTSKLRTLDYHSNRIKEFSGMDDAAALETIDLSDNDLASVGGFMFRDTNLLKLAKLNNNSIETIDPRAFLPRSPLIIDLSNNFLKDVRYNNWVATQELYLNHNQIIHIDGQAFQGMTSLEKLDLSQNRLFTLHEDLFHHFINLKYLNLSRNYLSNLPWVNLFHNLDQLDTLDLGHNNISHLGASMLRPLPKTRTLYLQTNLLHKINPRVFTDAPGLKLVDLSNNPFDCSCDTHTLKLWLQRTKISVLGLYVRNSTAYHCRSPPDRTGTHVLQWTEGDFECSNSMLYLIVVCSMGILFVTAGVVGSVTCQFYTSRKLKVQQMKKQKEEQDREKAKQIADMVRLSKQEVAQAIQEAIDRKHRQYSKIQEVKDKQNNYITRSRQVQKPTQPEECVENIQDRDKKHSNDQHLKKETGRGRTRQYDKLKKDELNKEELEKQKGQEKVAAEDKHIDKRESERRQQRDDRFDPHFNDRRAALIRKLQQRYRDPHSDAQRRNKHWLFNYEYDRGSRYRLVPVENIRRNGPYIIYSADTLYDAQDTAVWQHAAQADDFQESRLPYYQTDGHQTVPAVGRERPQQGREARGRERIPEHRRDHLPSDVNFADEGESRHYNGRHPDEHPNTRDGHQRSQSYGFLPDDYSRQKPYFKRDRAQRQYESFLQTHRHPSQRAASQPVLATDWL